MTLDEKKTDLTRAWRFLCTNKKKLKKSPFWWYPA